MPVPFPIGGGANGVGPNRGVSAGSPAPEVVCPPRPCEGLLTVGEAAAKPWRWGCSTDEGGC